jgi:hypothetical protein
MTRRFADLRVAVFVPNNYYSYSTGFALLILFAPL